MRMLVTCKCCRPHKQFAIRATNLQDTYEEFKKSHFIPLHYREHKWFKRKALEDLARMRSGRLSVADYVEETQKLEASMFVIESLPETVLPGTELITPEPGGAVRERLKERVNETQVLGKKVADEPMEN